MVFHSIVLLDEKGPFMPAPLRRIHCRLALLLWVLCFAGAAMAAPTAVDLDLSDTTPEPGKAVEITGTLSTAVPAPAGTLSVRDGTTVLRSVRLGPALAVGFRHGCWIRPTGGVSCWGANESGQLGKGGGSSSSVPGNVGGLPAPAVALAAGRSHTCALLGDGTLWCWGDNARGQLGVGDTADRPAPARVSGLPAIVAVAAGNETTCATTAAGALLCWGRNVDGQVGDGTRTSRSRPTAVKGLGSGVRSVSVGFAATCAVTTAGALKCWGGNGAGQLGTGDSTDRLTPADVVGLGSRVDSVSAGVGHACAVRTSGALLCWGANFDGQIGDGTTAARLRPTPVSRLTEGVRSVGAAESSTCAQALDGAVHCWGSNEDGRFGTGDTTDSLAPRAVPRLAAGVLALAVGNDGTCAETAAGQPMCWGLNDFGMTGTGSSAARLLVPTLVSGSDAGVLAVAAGETSTCWLIRGGRVRCAGWNANGQLGNGTTTSSGTPQAVDGLPLPAVALDVGYRSACVLLMDARIACWGHGAYGGLGFGDYADRLKAEVVPNLSGVRAITVAFTHSCAILADGSARCWGLNTYAELGTGDKVASTTPKAVAGLAGVRLARIRGGANHTCAVTTAGGLKCWGSNVYGELGTGDRTERLLPTDVAGLTSGVRDVAVGYQFTCAVLTAGGVKCWGLNGYGQLGRSGGGWSVLPGDVTGLTSGALSVALSVDSACAQMQDGSARCWGNNDYGQLGNGAFGNSSVPVVVTKPGGAVVAIDMRYRTTCSVTTGGPRCWGRNEYSQFGRGTTDSSAVPLAPQGLGAGATVRRITVSRQLAAGKHTLAVRFSGDAAHWPSATDRAVTSKDGNKPPVVTPAKRSIVIAEDTTSTGRKVGATDPEGGKLTYRVSTRPDHGTVLLTAAGVWRYRPAKDFAGKDAFRIRATDPKGGFATLAVSVTVTPKDDRATGFAVSKPTPIRENTRKATVVASITIADVDGVKGTLAVSDRRFAISGRQLVLRAGQVVDREAGAAIPLTVTLTDGPAVFRSKLSVPVTDVDEFRISKPADADGRVNLVIGGAAVRAAVGITVRARDRDATGSDIAYSLVEPTGEFTIGRSSGIVRVAGPILPALGRERTIKVRARSADGSTATASFGLRIDPTGVSRIGDGDDENLDGTGWNDRIWGRGGDDRIRGAAGRDRLYGEAGNDELEGGGGADILDGGPGGDYLVGGPGDDELDGGLPLLGVDWADYADADAAITLRFRSGVVRNRKDGVSSEGIDTLVFATVGSRRVSTIEGVIGSRFDDYLDGRGVDAARLEGGPGDDTMIGDGAKLLKQRASYRTARNAVLVDLAKGTARNLDPAKSTEGVDTLVGIAMISGSEFADRLIGDGKTNVFTGFGGADRITTGRGADEVNFVYPSDSTPAAPDEVTDFSVKGGDWMDLSIVGADAWVGRKAFTAGAGRQVRWSPAGGGCVVEVDLDSDAAAEMVIRLPKTKSMSRAAVQLVGDPDRGPGGSRATAGDGG